MKIRLGFVSNSSSEQSICPLCEGVLDIGWGGEMYDEWDEGHTVCSNKSHYMHIACALEFLCEKDVKVAEKRQKSTWEDGEPTISPKHCPICTAQFISSDQVIEHLLNILGKGKDEVKKDIRTKLRSTK